MPNYSWGRWQVVVVQAAQALVNLSSMTLQKMVGGQGTCTYAKERNLYEQGAQHMVVVIRFDHMALPKLDDPDLEPDPRHFQHLLLTLLLTSRIHVPWYIFEI